MRQASRFFYPDQIPQAGSTLHQHHHGRDQATAE
jgi:hypothetical protein